MSKPVIGIAGVGLMGLGIATNVAQAGYRLVFLEHEGNQPTDDLVRLGATSVGSGAELGRQCDVIILCVTGAPQIKEVLSCEEGILSGLRTGTLLIDCSTSLPETTADVAIMVGERGGRFIDAPMTRTPKEAMEGRLNLIVGGEQADVDDAMALLECFAENITHVGAVGAGHVMKLVHNYVSLGFTAVLAEASASASKAGIDPQVLVDVLAKGGGSSVVLERMKPFILEGDPSGLMFSIANADKDVGYYCQMLDGLEMDGVAADGILELFSGQVKKGNGGEMLPLLIQLLLKES